MLCNMSTSGCLVCHFLMTKRVQHKHISILIEYVGRIVRNIKLLACLLDNWFIVGSGSMEVACRLAEKGPWEVGEVTGGVGAGLNTLHSRNLIK